MVFVEEYMYESQYNQNPQSIKFVSPTKNMLKYFQTKRLSILIILAFYTIILYFSWIKDSTLRSESHFIPEILLKIANTNPNARTAEPFVPVGFLMYSEKLNSRLGAILSLTLVSIAEVGQFFIHSRTPSFFDVIFGLLGHFLGVFSAIVLFLLIKNFTFLLHHK